MKSSVPAVASSDDYLPSASLWASLKSLVAVLTATIRSSRSLDSFLNTVMARMGMGIFSVDLV